MKLDEAFTDAAQKHGCKTALCWGELEYSYGQFLAQARQAASRLQHKFGVKPGDRVGVWLKNCPEFVPALFGVWLAGGVVVPINSFLKSGEVSHILADAGIDVLISQSTLGEPQASLRAARPSLRIVPGDDLAAGTDPAAVVF